MRPPLASTNPREIASPRPPPSSDGRPWKNGSKTRARWGGGVPGPGALRRTRALPPAAARRLAARRAAGDAHGVAVEREAHRVVEEVGDDALELRAVGVHRGKVGR